MTNVLRIERCHFFANAPYSSGEKCWKSWAMSPVLAVFSDKCFFNFFFIFTILGEEILVRAHSSTTLVNAEHFPKQLSVYSPLQHTLPWLCLPKHRWFWDMVPLPIDLFTAEAKECNECDIMAGVHSYAILSQIYILIFMRNCANFDPM